MSHGGCSQLVAYGKLAGSHVGLLLAVGRAWGNGTFNGLGLLTPWWLVSMVRVLIASLAFQGLGSHAGSLLLNMGAVGLHF